jgi:hypothetical protein
MELSIHDVESLSLTGENVEGDDPYKVIRIKINGWKNVITLYCKADIICDSKGWSDPAWKKFAGEEPWQDDGKEAELAAWQDDGGEG